MAMTKEAIVAAVLALDEADRLDVCERITASVGTGGVDLGPEWDAEIRRRLADVAAGRVVPLTWDEAERRMFGDGNVTPA